MKMKIRTCFVMVLTVLAAVSMGIATESDPSVRALMKAGMVERALTELEVLVPEVHVYDRLALARSALQTARRLQHEGKHQAAEKAFQDAVAKYTDVQNAYLAFAATMINVPPKTASLGETFDTLPEFFRQLEQPDTAPRDAIDEFYRQPDAPKPKWIFFPNTDYPVESWLFGPNAELQRHEKVRVARFEFDLDEVPQRGWMQVGFTSGGVLSINGKDITGWMGSNQDGNKHRLTEYLRRGKNVLAINFYLKPLLGMGVIARGGVLLKSGKVIPLTTGVGQWKVSPQPPADRNFGRDQKPLNDAVTSWAALEFDASDWSSAPVVPAGGSLPKIDFYDDAHPELTTRVLSDHTPWARPLRGGPVRVFGLVPWGCSREFVELAERVELDLNVAVDASWSSLRDVTGLLDRIKRPYDVSVVGGIRWSDIDKAVRDELLKYVRNGGGLVYVAARGAKLADFEADLNKGDLQASDQGSSLTQRIPCKHLALLRDHPQKKLIQTFSLAKGRIAFIEYPKGGRCFNMALTPHTIANVDTQPLDYDYYQALVARATLWAADRLSAVQWTAAHKAGRVAVEITEPAAGKVREVRVRLRSRQDGVIHDKTISLDAKSGSNASIAFDLPPLPGGEFFVDCWLMDGPRVVDWQTFTFETSSPGVLKTLAVSPTVLADGKQTLRVNLDPPPANATLRAELVNSNGQITARKEIPARAGDVQFSLTPGILSTNEMVARVWLLDGTKPVERLSERFFVAQNWDGRLIWGGWPGNGQPTEIVWYRQWEHLKKVGLNGLIPTILNPWDSVAAPMASLKLDLFNVPYAGRGIELFWTDEQRKKYKKDRSVDESLKLWAATSPLAYSLGDDIWLAKVHAEILPYRKAYIAFLRKLYGRNLATLNQSWGTNLATWTDIKPLATRAKPDEKKEYKIIEWSPALLKNHKYPGNLPKKAARWMDENRFQQERFHKTYDWLQAEVRKADPSANRFCVEGVVPRLFASLPWPDLCRNYFMKGGYLENIVWAYSSPDFAQPGTINTTWIGDYGPRPAGWHEWFIWRQVFLKQHALVWWAFKPGTPADRFGWIGACQWADHRVKDYTREAGKDIRRIQQGLDRLIHKGRFDRQPIALFYSQLSDDLTREPTPLGDTKQAMGAWYEVLEDIGITPHWLDPKDIAAGALGKRGIRVLILPYSVCMSDETAKTITRFVEDGGVVIADVRPGLRNEHGNVIGKTGQLGSLFGVEWGDLDKMPAKNITLFGATGWVGDTALVVKKANVGKRIRRLPTQITRTAGKGQAHLLNVLLTNYRQGTESSFRGSCYGNDLVGRRANAMRRMVSDLLRTYGIESSVRLVANGQPLPAMIRTIDLDETKLLCMLRPGPWDTSHFAGGPEATLHLGQKAHVYDVLHGVYHGYVDRIEGPFDNQSGKVFALLPYRVDSLNLSFPEAARQKRGNPLKIHVKLSLEPRNNKVTATHAFSLYFRDPDGNLMGRSPQTSITKTSELEVEFPIPWSGSAGVWELTAVDVCSGVAQQATFNVE